MNPLNTQSITITIDDRERNGPIPALLEADPTIITTHGRPVFLALPFDEMLVREGFGLALALRLFQQTEISLGKAARQDGMDRLEFTKELARRRIPLTDQSKTELDSEFEQI